MNVIFLTHGPKTASSRYRVFQYIPYLEENAVKADVVPIAKGMRERWHDIKSLDAYDLVFIQKKLFAVWQLERIRSKAKALVYDFDDAVMFRDSSAENHDSRTRRIRFSAMMRNCDHVIAGNDYLARHAFYFTKNITKIPTTIDAARYAVKQKNESQKRSKITLGWIGGRSTLPYLEGIADALEVLSERCADLELKVVSDTFPDFQFVQVVEKEWKAEEEVADVQSFDIGLMPLPDDPWTRGKCGLKILQYFSASKPVVCSPVGANKEIVADGQSGFWARGRDEWVEKIDALIQNRELRDSFGANGRKRVEEKYSIEVNAPLFLSVLRDVGLGG